MMTYTCNRCGKANRFVNECGCDPFNLPTHPSEDDLVDARAANQAELEDAERVLMPER